MNRMYAGYMNPGAKRGTALRFTPPGFKFAVDIPFPGRVLPVCARCKKNYKTREHCRTKEQHHTLPWTDTYICMTLDNSCFDQDGNLRVEEGPFAAHGVQSQPYIYPEEMKLDPKTPSCAQCKDKNYTRTYCRTSKKHKTLPWSTVYIMLTMNGQSEFGGMQGHGMGGMHDPSALGAGGTAGKKKRKAAEEVKAEPEDENGNESDVKKKKGSEGDEGGVKEESTAEVKTDAEGGGEETVEEKEEQQEEKEKSPTPTTDIFKNPHSSKTFLCTVSLNKNEVKWVDIDASHAATVMQSRNSKNSDPEGMDGGVGQMYPPSPYMMHPSMGGMGMGMGMGMHHPQMGHFPPMPHGGHGQHSMGNPPPSGGNNEDDAGENGRDPNQGGNPNHMDNGQHQHQQQPWMNQHNHGGMGGPGQFHPDMMYQQMMDPRAAGMGYGGYQPWHGRGGYPMEMGGGMQGGPPGQMQYDGHMMQPMGWGGPPQQQGGQMHPGGQGGSGDMGGNMDPGMMQQMNWGGPSSQHPGGGPPGGSPSQHPGGMGMQAGPGPGPGQHQFPNQRMQHPSMQHSPGNDGRDQMNGGPPNNGNENGVNDAKAVGDNIEAQI